MDRAFFYIKVFVCICAFFVPFIISTEMLVTLQEAENQVRFVQTDNEVVQAEEDKSKLRMIELRKYHQDLTLVMFTMATVFSIFMFSIRGLKLNNECS